MRGQRQADALGKNKIAQFVAFLAADERALRRAILYTPLTVAVCAFILNTLIRRKSITESLLYFAGVFLLVCFIGLVAEILKRGRFR